MIIFFRPICLSSAYIGTALGGRGAYSLVRIYFSFFFSSQSVFCYIMLCEENLGRTFSIADFLVTLAKSQKINCAKRALSPGGGGGGEVMLKISTFLSSREKGDICNH